MEFQKIALGEIEKCYATLGLLINGEPHLFFAGEGQGSLQVFSGEGFARRQTIWQGGGGTMSIVAVPGRPGWLLVSRGFYSMVESQGSTIEIVRYNKGVFSHQSIARLPYLHRFGLLTAANGTRWVLAASIASHKENKEDWRHPGHLYACALPENLDESFQLSWAQLPGDFTINHGFCQVPAPGGDLAYVSAREGVFCVTPPAAAGEGWRIEPLLRQPVSDIAVLDIDGDGQQEIAALLPFHGNQCKVFKNLQGRYKEIYSHPAKNDFYHTVVGGQLGGRQVFICGARKEAAQLFLLTWNAAAGTFDTQVLDEGAGPSNAAVLNTPQRDYLLAANRMVFEAAVYTTNKP